MDDTPTPMAHALGTWITDEAVPFVWRYLGGTASRIQRTNGAVQIITHDNLAHGVVHRIKTAWNGYHDGEGLTPKPRHSAHFHLALHTEVPRFLEAFEGHMLPFLQALNAPSSLTVGFYAQIQMIAIKRTNAKDLMMHNFSNPREVHHALHALNAHSL